jgi:molecular chaperone GrpE
MTTTDKTDKIINEEIETQEVVEEVNEPAEQKVLDDYEQVVAKLQAQVVAANDSAARSLADYQNLIRRHREERANLVKYATSDFVVSLVEPFDNLRLAASALNDKGLNMVVEQFHKVLADQGVTQLSPEGKKFDAATMEAVEKVGDGEKVKQVLSPGYIMVDKVIKPARVIVG